MLLLMGRSRSVQGSLAYIHYTLVSIAHTHRCLLSIAFEYVDGDSDDF